MSPCTNCKKLTTHHTTFDALTGVNIIKPGERLCDECYKERGKAATTNLKMELNKIHNSDCIEGMKLLPDNCVDCCVTSPPYFGLRDYNVDGQIGLEETPELFVAKMVEVFTEVKRVLKPTGNLWLNLGDTYAAYYGDKYGKAQGLSGKRENIGDAPPCKKSFDFKKSDFKPKDLLGIPWMVAFALRSIGYYLRGDIIWDKPNPMPESVTDRPTKAHEYIFLLSKSQKYYYDAGAIKQPLVNASLQRLSQDIENQKGSDRVPGKTNGSMKAVGKTWEQRKSEGEVNRQGLAGAKATGTTCLATPEAGANKRSVWKQDDPFMVWEWLFNNAPAEVVEPLWYEFIAQSGNLTDVWTVTTKPFSEAHFATFPEDLIVDCIKAGCPLGGVVLDPFMGAGTTALVASKLDRNFIGFELNPDYIKIATKRLRDQLGMFNKSV